MNFVLFLQNAWSPYYAGRHWPRPSWLQALIKSRSGRRLRVLFDGDVSLYGNCHNTTPIVGRRPNSIVPPDLSHIQTILSGCDESSAVVTCGKQAFASIVDHWQGKLLAIPHPAARTLKNEVYQRANEILFSGFNDRIMLQLTKDPPGWIERAI